MKRPSDTKRTTIRLDGYIWTLVPATVETTHRHTGPAETLARPWRARTRGTLPWSGDRDSTSWLVMDSSGRAIGLLEEWGDGWGCRRVSGRAGVEHVVRMQILNSDGTLEGALRALRS